MKVIRIGYTPWKYAQSILALLFLCIIAFSNQISWPAAQVDIISVFLLGFLYVHMLGLILIIKASLFRAANLITLLRAFGTLPLLIYIKPAASTNPVLLISVITLVCTDLVDGFVAKKSGTTASGALLDEETDAFFTLILAYLLYRNAEYGLWILSFGGIRYVFVLLFAITGKRNTYPAQFSAFSRRVCAISVSTLAGGFALFLPLWLRTGALTIAIGLLTTSFIWESALNFNTDRMRKFRGILKSFIIYYAVPTKRLRMRRLYSLFLSHNSLAFDIGSHIGNRIGVWSRIGARVVALEPNPDCKAIILALHGHRSNLTFLPFAAGSRPGRTVLYCDPVHPTLNTLSTDWMKKVKATSPFAAVEWTTTYETEVVTLDKLIEEYGVPDFCKIDVEGFELEVLRGLSTPLPALSVEYLPSAIEEACRCVNYLQDLGQYEFNLSARETMRLKWNEWQPAGEICRVLRQLDVHAAAGDVYAQLKPPLRETQNGHHF